MPSSTAPEAQRVPTGSDQSVPSSSVFGLSPRDNASILSGFFVSSTRAVLHTLPPTLLPLLCTARRAPTPPIRPVTTQAYGPGAEQGPAHHGRCVRHHY